MSYSDSEVSIICNLTEIEKENLKNLWDLLEEEDCKQVLGKEIFSTLFELIPDSQFLFKGQTFEESTITSNYFMDNHTVHFLSLFDKLLEYCYTNQKDLFHDCIKKLVQVHLKKGVKVIHVRYLITIMFLKFRKNLGKKFTIPLQRTWLKFSTNILMALVRQVQFYQRVK